MKACGWQAGATCPTTTGSPTHRPPQHVHMTPNHLHMSPHTRPTTAPPNHFHTTHRPPAMVPVQHIHQFNITPQHVHMFPQDVHLVQDVQEHLFPHHLNMPPHHLNMAAQQLHPNHLYMSPNQLYMSPNHIYMSPNHLHRHPQGPHMHPHHPATPRWLATAAATIGIIVGLVSRFERAVPAMPQTGHSRRGLSGSSATCQGPEVPPAPPRPAGVPDRVLPPPPPFLRRYRECPSSGGTKSLPALSEHTPEGYPRLWSTAELNIVQDLAARQGLTPESIRRLCRSQLAAGTGQVPLADLRTQGATRGHP
mmetsp:Transcript_136521/g.236918  ORF Transcript_136521/g.236918 Transcript_136521/m.236918 type:complete len:308 (+) Transcript_136521:329-1252(+)